MSLLCNRLWKNMRLSRLWAAQQHEGARKHSGRIIHAVMSPSASDVHNSRLCIRLVSMTHEAYDHTINNYCPPKPVYWRSFTSFSLLQKGCSFWATLSFTCVSIRAASSRSDLNACSFKLLFHLLLCCLSFTMVFTKNPTSAILTALLT